MASRQFRMRIPSVADSGNVRLFDYGTILIPMGMQKNDPQTIRNLMQTIAREDVLNVFAVSTGQTDSGIDLGSPGFVPLKTPQIALLIGKGTDVYNAGEVWHLLDQHYNIAISLIDASHGARHRPQSL